MRKFACGFFYYIYGTREGYILKIVKKRKIFLGLFGTYSEKHYFCSVLLKWYTITEE